MLTNKGPRKRPKPSINTVKNYLNYLHSTRMRESQEKGRLRPILSFLEPWEGGSAAVALIVADSVLDNGCTRHQGVLGNNNYSIP